jgi:hypothetical protein
MPRSPGVPGRLTSVLLVPVAVVLATIAVPVTLRPAQTIALAVAGGTVAALTGIHLHIRRLAWLLVMLVLLSIGDHLVDQAGSLDRPWTLPVAVGGAVFWTAVPSGTAAFRALRADAA